MKHALKLIGAGVVILVIIAAVCGAISGVLDLIWGFVMLVFHIWWLIVIVFVAGWIYRYGVKKLL